jgi:hypothetical protein
MPQRCSVAPSFTALLVFQDQVVHRDQALLKGFTSGAIKHRLSTKQWHGLLPGVYLTHPGEASRRQLLVAALLYAGSDAAIDGADACRFHGIKYVPIDEDVVHVMVPQASQARSRGFVNVRRSLAPVTGVSTDLLRFVDPATAVIAATRRMSNRRSVLAALSDALQREITTYEELVRAHVQGPPRNSTNADDALEDLGAGTRSAPEADFRRLVLASTVLPAVDYNVWLRLPTGRVVCVDALITSSGVVHETNGRAAHARADLFGDMQERHDALTASGLIVLHNAPNRIRTRGREVIVQVERCHQMYEGRGLPDGVEVVREPVGDARAVSNGDGIG